MVISGLEGSGIDSVAGHLGPVAGHGGPAPTPSVSPSTCADAHPKDTHISNDAPAVETKGSGGVGETSATLFASVNPRGGSVGNCKFEYGTTTGYGSSASCVSLPGSGSSPVVVDASIASGLAADTTYHYRISATNSAGTSKGGDVTFKTS